MIKWSSPLDLEMLLHKGGPNLSSAYMQVPLGFAALPRGMNS